MTALSLDSALGQCYRKSVLESDHAGAVSYLTGILQNSENAATLTEARAFLTRANALATKGDLSRRCFVTYTKARVVKEVLAAL